MRKSSGENWLLSLIEEWRLTLVPFAGSFFKMLLNKPIPDCSLAIVNVGSPSKKRLEL